MAVDGPNDSIPLLYAADTSKEQTAGFVTQEIEIFCTSEHPLSDNEADRIGVLDSAEMEDKFSCTQCVFTKTETYTGVAEVVPVGGAENKPN